MEMEPQAGYPTELEVDAAAAQGRVGVLFRLVLAIPHLILLELLVGALGIVSFLAWFAILFTGRFPQGLHALAVGISRWNARVSAYVGLLTDRYPPFSLEEEAGYPVRLSVEERIEGRNRVTTFFRAILIIPHVIVLSLLGIVVSAAVVAAWVIALLAGRVPDVLHDFLAGYLGWTERVNAYGSLLVDDYPSFRLG